MSIVNESDHRIRLAVVGAGVIGTIHGAVISGLADRIDLVAVVDLHPERAEKLAADHGGTAFTSLTDALQAVDIDVVSGPRAATRRSACGCCASSAKSPTSSSPT